MPVYRKHKLVHIHIPKNAGTVIERFFFELGDMTWHPESWVGQEYRDGRWYEYQHLSMEELLNFTGVEFHGFRSFAVVRNPYSRLLSEYFWRELIVRDFPDAPVLAFESIKSFIESIPDDISSNWDGLTSESNEAQTNFLIHVRPQQSYIFHKNRERLVNEILRFEQLEKDFARLLRRYGLTTDSINPPNEWCARTHLDRHLLDQVNRIYAKDFELGGYEML